MKILNWIALRWQGICLSLLVLITILSLIPLPELPTAGSDKISHFIAYGAIALPIGLSMHQSWWRHAVYCAAWSGAIELIQPYVNRNGEWLDFLANTLGVLAGVLIGIALRKAGSLQERQP